MEVTHPYGSEDFQTLVEFCYSVFYDTKAEFEMTVESVTSDLQIQLARKIVQRIYEGSIKNGAHLREIELSKEFSVSRTPVRAALGYLMEQGFVEKRANRGFFVTAEKEDCTNLLQGLPKTDDEHIKEKISRDWFEGRIGKEVSEGEIRNRYKLGRLTGQRILNGLSEDGIVSRMPGYGWMFEPTLNSAKAHDESYDFRIVLEPEAICSATFAYDEIAADALRERHEQVLATKEENLSAAELFRLDEDFHNFLASCSRNRFIVQAVKQQNRLRRLLEYNSLVNTGRLKGSCMEHIEILNCLAKKNYGKAAEVMKVHLQNAKNAGPNF